MGFFSKLWKGVKKGFKKIFKPIKKVFKSIGKFMGKIGIVGQIALSFILPGIGTMLSGMLSNVVGSLAGGALGGIGKAAGWVLGKAHEFGKLVGAGYKTVTGAVTDFIGTAGKYVGGKLNIGTLPNQTLSQAFGKEGWGGRLSDSFSKLGDAATEFWDMDIKGSLPKPEINLSATSKPKTLEEMYSGPEQEVSVSTSGASNIIPDQQSFKLDAGLEPEVTPEGLQLAKIDDKYVSLADPIEKPSFSMENYLENASTKTASTDVKTLEVFGAAAKNQSLLSKVGEKAVDRFASIPANLAQRYGGQKLGIYDKPQGDPGPQWGGYTSPYSSQQYASMPQQTQQMPSAFTEFTMGQSFNTDPNGSWLGNDYWADYMRRTQAFTSR